MLDDVTFVNEWDTCFSLPRFREEDMNPNSEFMCRCQRFNMADGDDGAPLSVWIGLSIIAALSFYSQAVVTEER
jgi:hypothetical protein